MIQIACFKAYISFAFWILNHNTHKYTIWFAIKVQFVGIYICSLGDARVQYSARAYVL